MPFEIFFFNDDFYQTCIFKFSNFTYLSCDTEDGSNDAENSALTSQE